MKPFTEKKFSLTTLINMCEERKEREKADVASGTQSNNTSPAGTICDMLLTWTGNEEMSLNKVKTQYFLVFYVRGRTHDHCGISFH